MMRASALVAVAAAWLCAGCNLGGSVVRIVDGQEIRGRVIGTDAYANYTRGMLLELAESYAEAERAYQRAVDDDPDSPELWTRVGLVSCRLKNRDGAASALSRADGLDPEYGPLAIAQSECARFEGDPKRALAHARRAVVQDPNNPHATATVIVALEASGKAREALNWAISDALEHASPSAWKRVATLAKRAGDPAWALHAGNRARALKEAIARSGGAVESCEAATRADLDSAIASGKLGLARSLANRCRLGPGILASRAAALGAAKLAQAQALHVLAANPTDGDAQVALWVAADLRGEIFPGTPRATPTAPLSPLSSRLMAEMLRRRAGDDAARAWIRAAPTLPAPSDALERGIDDRLRKAGLSQTTRSPPSPKKVLRF